MVASQLVLSLLCELYVKICCRSSALGAQQQDPKRLEMFVLA